MIRRALYGSKVDERGFRNHIRSCVSHLNFRPCFADPEVWLRPGTKSHVYKDYEQASLHAYDTLVVSENAESVIRNEIKKCFKLNKH